MNFILLIILLVYGYVLVRLKFSILNFKSKLQLFILSLLLIISINFYEKFIGYNDSINRVFCFLPLIHLINFEFFRTIFTFLLKKHPYIPFREKIGVKVMGTGFPKNRRVQISDYIFLFIQLLTPLIIIILYGVFISKN